MPRIATQISLSESDREQLLAWSRRPKTAQALASRSRIIIAAADGYSNAEIAEDVGVSPVTVSKWRNRFAESGLDGLADAPRSGAPRKISDQDVERVLAKTIEEKPKNATHWTSRTMAAATGMSQSSISRIWRAFSLQPHRSETFKLSNDPLFVDKVRDIVGLYMDPPDKALVLCVDEKSQIQALYRSQPGLPLKKSRAAGCCRNGWPDPPEYARCHYR